MAEPVDFPQSNFTWRGGPTPDIGDLPSFRDPAEQLTISCWKLTPEELEEVKETGQVWLYVWGHRIPVAIGGMDPWKDYSHLVGKIGGENSDEMGCTETDE